MPSLPNSLAFRLTFWYASAFILFLLIALLALYLSINSILAERIDDDLREDIDEFSMLLDNAGLDRVKNELKREILPGEEQHAFLRLLDTRGHILFSSDMSHWKGMQPDPARLEQFADPATEPVMETLSVASQASDVRVVYGLIGPGLILQIGESLEDRDEIMDLLLDAFFFLCLVIIPLASTVGWFMARQATTGIQEVSRAATDIEAGEFDRRVTIKARDREIRELAQTFNAMAERIRNLITEMREMIDNIAHDLRSPLARIRAISESALTGEQSMEHYRSATAGTLEECDRLITLVNATLDVAEAEAGLTSAAKQAIDLSKLARDACELFEAVAEEKNISLSCQLEAGCRLTGNRQNLQRMLANLLDNALKYTAPQGSVRVTLERLADSLQLGITDTGQGISEAEQQRVFERFYRCDESRGHSEGCGLGLSFARSVARAHGGDIALSSTPGNGSTFTITLPVNSATQA